MLRQEATDLAVRIGQCFNGPPIDVWEEDLGQLDAGRAGTALARLRREHEHRWLSIAQFMAAYRSVRTDDASNAVPHCDECDNTGWKPAADLVRNPGTETEHRNTQVRPCTCQDGRRAAESAVWKHRGNEDAA